MPGEFCRELLEGLFGGSVLGAGGQQGDSGRAVEGGQRRGARERVQGALQNSDPPPAEEPGDGARVIFVANVDGQHRVSLRERGIGARGQFFGG
ncbi:hypothetical protein NBRGN_046_00150 [Nocardia brasiliensis NBRC 14402]|uniref:hypothetical protein n=1 Tax=Nocardia brasiliensis TaxID=37326 RepID=UPI00045C6117|nr:hypothetical protein [Nocardia brasiliensis]GAJ82050.1 hypothetical protein NBRGN_046_00150 [Nocardia brasiliensis NBRC 14402]